jgi:hypothetical protein
MGGAAISAAIASPLTPYRSASWRFSRAVRMLRTITDAESPSATTTTSASTACAATNRLRLTTRKRLRRRFACNFTREKYGFGAFPGR